MPRGFFGVIRYRLSKFRTPSQLLSFSNKFRLIMHQFYSLRTIESLQTFLTILKFEDKC